MNIEKCPFCGASELKEIHNSDDEIAYCVCMQCLARGPEVYEPKNITANCLGAWNTRKHHLTIEFADLKRNEEDAKIRLYGALWLLVEDQIISEGRARELGNMPLYKMIDQCMEYRVNNDEP